MWMRAARSPSANSVLLCFSRTISCISEARDCGTAQPRTCENLPKLVPLPTGTKRRRRKTEAPAMTEPSRAGTRRS